MDTLQFEFRDMYSISKPTKEDIEVWNDSLGTDYIGERKGLRVVIEATHSALINRNLRWYVPSRMADGALTFINGNKPAKILKHHDSHSDPVGVVRGATFISTVPADLVDNPDVATLLSSSAEIKDQIKAMKRLIKAGITSRDDWKGLGYIEVVADILDKETIEQLNDGRFDAVSTSFRTPGHAYCFICGQNWGQDGPCEHFDLGEMYEDEDEDEWPMMLVPGLHLYDELSLVVQDADPLTLIRMFDGKEDGFNREINYEDVWKNNIPTSQTMFEFRDFKEDKMAKPTMSDSAKAVLSLIKKLRPDMEEATLKDFAVKIAELKQEDNTYPNQTEANLDEETAVEYALESFESADKEVNADEIYADMEKEFDAMKEEGILTEDNKKLNSEDIEKLPDSVFCGPNRSFPVPDCAHVTAATRLVGKYKGPGNKSEILANVNRRAEALGYADSKNTDESDDDSEDNGSQVGEKTFEIPTCDMLTSLSKEDALSLYALISTELTSRDLRVERGCSMCADSQRETKEAKEKLEVSEKNIEDLNNTLGVLRGELRFQMEDYMAQVDRFVQLTAELHNTKLEKLALVGVLGGKYDSMDNAKESLRESNLEVEGTAIMDSFDLTKAVEKLNDGMANSPSGDTIDSPVVNIDGDNLALPTSLGEPALAAIENIKELLNEGEDSKAKRLYDKMNTFGMFSDAENKKLIDFETISASVKGTSE